MCSVAKKYGYPGQFEQLITHEISFFMQTASTGFPTSSKVFCVRISNSSFWDHFHEILPKLRPINTCHLLMGNTVNLESFDCAQT